MVICEVFIIEFTLSENLRWSIFSLLYSYAMILKFKGQRVMDLECCGKSLKDNHENIPS